MRLCLLTFWVASPVQAHSLGPDFVALSAAVLPTTVHIRVERGPLVAAGIQQMARDFSIPSQGHTQGQVVLSSGSGVILSASGTVLTNHHVINGAQAIVITTYDQRRYQATVVGADPRTDIAVLQIQGDGPFDAANFEAGAPLAVGAWVVAVGHPFDFPFTVTAGIVSALGRRGLGTMRSRTTFRPMLRSIPARVAVLCLMLRAGLWASILRFLAPIKKTWPALASHLPFQWAWPSILAQSSPTERR